LKIAYNERSWAIDLITEINIYTSSRDRKIKHAGGELTISTASGRLFPDILLYGETSLANILQGWELKFPDTPVTDPELIENATKKAQYLGLNSFLLWNVTTAVLYVSNDLTLYDPVKTWNDLADITRRQEVEPNRAVWIELLHKILDELNDFYESGNIKVSTIIDALSENTIYKIILLNVESVAEKLREAVIQDGYFDAMVKLWWRNVTHEYPTENDPLLVLARMNLVNWINKFVFAHILKHYSTTAAAVNSINEETCIQEAQKIFEEISNKNDFWNIFSSFLGEAALSEKAWSHLTQLNQFLYEIQFEKVDQIVLHQILQNTIFASKRKVAGQYATPYSLAELLVRLTMDNKSLLFFDPCCGTGTIPRAAYDVKLEYEQSTIDALSNTWASDKFSFPLQIATLAVSEPRNMGQVLHIFKKDIVELTTGLKIEFKNPYNGDPINESLPLFDYIASNLPFVQFEDIREMNPEVFDINRLIEERIGEKFTLSRKSDLYAYLPFYLWSLLADNGKLGIIVSNAWLGTDWGEKFQEVLKRFFSIKRVITSGVGRWFHNADIVTNIIILEKRQNVSTPSDIETTSFTTIEKSLQQIESENVIKDIASLIITETNSPGEIWNEKYTQKEIGELRNLGLGFNALFADLSWINDLKDKLIAVNEIFDFIRGERRGWNPLFYPAKGHGIEQDYIRPVLKSPKSVKGLIAETDREAFCCSKTIAELRALRHRGAFSWINKFEHEVNGKGLPLTDSLKRPGMLWYEMQDNTTADLVALINYDKRLYIGKMRQRSFVDQRLIGMSLSDHSIDIDICHALMNSSLGLFYIEALGFGRGLGALDLSATKLETRLFMLNPGLLEREDIAEIKRKFAPLLRREVLPIMDELTMTDRTEFDKTIFKAFNIEDYRDKIIGALKQIYNIRKSVDA